jgi:hypothetical protein
VLDAHQEGFAIVGGAIETDGRRAGRALAAWAPGPGRVPAFAGPLLLPSVVAGLELTPSPGPGGLPAIEPSRDHPHRREPWVYDGRIRARLRSGRPRG